ncbi:MAG: restriction endonuclease subunit S [Dechloromonas sp.]|uniref:Restriction endonuclease subunit S n=1 Tax=Candidatus Dechloromonas phosphorivorans TaxID=2899244 RepID=A0A9D7LP50_9RHOO|nr:restriction endonuclease subunit S [Candidatus Dechloromonas phosphorivorans]
METPDLRNAGGGPGGTEGLPIIRIQNLNGRNFDFYSGPTDSRWIVDPGQLLFAWAGTKGVSFGPTIWRGGKGVLNQHIFKVIPNGGIDNIWLYWALRYVTNRIEANAHGFKATLVHVKKSDIDRQSVIVPDRRTQSQIAEIMQTWDEAIAVTEKLLANSRKLKLAMTQRFFDIRKQSVSNTPWRQYHLREVAQRIQRQADGAEHPILMISSGSGFVRQDEKYSRFMAGKSLNDYVLLKQGEFAYNKGNSKLYEFGCVFPLESNSDGLVPHVYVCFSLSNECDSAFFKYLFEADYLHDQLGALVNTGVRNNGLLNIRPADFMNVRVPVPSIDEQRMIARILDTASKEIAVREQEVAALKEQKRALMQQLLTGKRRIHVPIAEAAP